MQTQYAQLLDPENDTAIKPSAHTAYHSFQNLVEDESEAQLKNHGIIGEEIGICLEEAWKKVEQENGGFGRDMKGHVRLRVLLNQLKQTQSYSLLGFA